MKLNAILMLSAAMCASVTVSSAAHAQSLSDEVRCVLVSNAVAAGSNNPRGRQIGASVGAYFMGRLDARQPAQVKAAMAQQKQRRIAGSEAASLMNACTARAGRAEAELRNLAK
jgi:hypothetical protein